MFAVDRAVDLLPLVIKIFMLIAALEQRVVRLRC